MLKLIPPIISAELIYAMMLTGHGDDLLVCDINHPAASIARDTVWGEIINLSGCGIPVALEAILTLYPLDTFVSAPVMRMKVVGDPDKNLPLFDRVQKLVDSAAGHAIPMQALERFDFYAAARKCFAVVRTSDPGPYGCFILRKGVIEGLIG